MDEFIIQQIDKLKNSISDKDFIYIADDVIEELDKLPNSFDAIEPILKLMECNPNVDYGKPGSIVHFLEKFYKNGYEEKLVESLDRRPIKHTVWMLNRIINGTKGNRRKYFLNVLKHVIDFPNLEQDIVSLAQHFKTLHK